MSQWIGTKDVLIHRRTDAERAYSAPMPVTQAFSRHMSAQAQRPEPARPPQPARTARFPGFASAVIAENEVVIPRPPRQFSVQGVSPGNRPVWPENIAADGSGTTIPVYDGMLDGKPPIAAEPERVLQAAEQAAEAAAEATLSPIVKDAPVLIPDAEEFEGGIESYKLENENAVLAVYGLEHPMLPVAECGVATDVRTLHDQIARLEERITAMEARMEQSAGEMEAVEESSEAGETE